MIIGPPTFNQYDTSSALLESGIRPSGAEISSMALMKANEFPIGENLMESPLDEMLMRYSLKTIVVLFSTENWFNTTVVSAVTLKTAVKRLYFWLGSGWK